MDIKQLLETKHQKKIDDIAESKVRNGKDMICVFQDCDRSVRPTWFVVDWVHVERNCIWCRVQVGSATSGATVVLNLERHAAVADAVVIVRGGEGQVAGHNISSANEVACVDGCATQL